jgi:hypothetical protein
MSAIRTISIFLLLFGVLSGAGALAGEAAVIWQNPEKYADIESDDLDRQAFQARLFNTLEKEFSQLAGKLPEGSRLTVTVTNLDLAGERRIRKDGDFQRLVKVSNFPKIALDYTLTAASGTVLSEQQDMQYSDLDFLDAKAVLRASQSPQAFFYETEMIRHWFDGTLGQYR